MHTLRSVVATLFLPGCQYLGPKAAGVDVVRIKQECEVDVASASEVNEGEDDVTYQTVKVNPDCSIEVIVREAIGEHVKALGR